MTKKPMYGVLLALLIALTVMTSGVLAQEEAPDLVRLTVSKTDGRVDGHILERGGIVLLLARLLLNQPGYSLYREANIRTRPMRAADTSPGRWTSAGSLS